MDITISLDTGTEKKRLLKNVSEKGFGKKYYKILLEVDVFTGEYFISVFIDKVKVH